VLEQGGETEEYEEVVVCADGEVEGEGEIVPVSFFVMRRGGTGALEVTLCDLLRERDGGVTVEIDFVEVEREGIR